MQNFISVVSFPSIIKFYSTNKFLLFEFYSEYSIQCKQLNNILVSNLYIKIHRLYLDIQSWKEIMCKFLIISIKIL